MSCLHLKSLLSRTSSNFVIIVVWSLYLLQFSSTIATGQEYSVVNGDVEEEARQESIPFRHFPVKQTGIGVNITRILNAFFDSGYDKRVRPNYGGPPVDVGVTLYIISISSVSEVQMDFTSDFYFRQTWKDSRLAFEARPGIHELYVGAEVADRIWVPDTFFANEKSAYFHEATTPNTFLRIGHSGDVFRSVRLTVTASCPMDLQYFPLDRQLCTIEVESYGYSMADIRYSWAKGLSSVGIQPGLELPQFRLLGHRQKMKHVSLSTGNYSRLICEIQFARSMGYYLIQIYIPAGLIVIISWVSFWLHRNATPARVALGVTTVLTMTTLMSSTNAALPKISYIKSIDVYLGTCFVMVFASLLEYATVGYLGKRIAMKRSRLQQLSRMSEMHKQKCAAAAAAASVDPSAEEGGRISIFQPLQHPQTITSMTSSASTNNFSTQPPVTAGVITSVPEQPPAVPPRPATVMGNHIDHHQLTSSATTSSTTNVNNLLIKQSSLPYPLMYNINNNMTSPTTTAPALIVGSSSCIFGGGGTNTVTFSSHTTSGPIMSSSIVPNDLSSSSVGLQQQLQHPHHFPRRSILTSHKMGRGSSGDFIPAPEPFASTNQLHQHEEEEQNNSTDTGRKETDGLSHVFGYSTSGLRSRSSGHHHHNKRKSKLTSSSFLPSSGKKGRRDEQYEQGGVGSLQHYMDYFLSQSSQPTSQHPSSRLHYHHHHHHHPYGCHQSPACLSPGYQGHHSTTGDNVTSSFYTSTFPPQGSHHQIPSTRPSHVPPSTIPPPVNPSYPPPYGLSSTYYPYGRSGSMQMGFSPFQGTAGAPNPDGTANFFPFDPESSSTGIGFIPPVVGGPFFDFFQSPRLYGISPSDIDKYSRVVFPVCFVCFNLMYWVIYMHISDVVVEDLVPPGGS